MLNFDHGDAEDEKDGDPGRAREKPKLDRLAGFGAPAAAHDIAHRLAGARAWQVPVEQNCLAISDSSKYSRYSLYLKVFQVF